MKRLIRNALYLVLWLCTLRLFTGFGVVFFDKPWIAALFVVMGGLALMVTRTAWERGK